MVRAASGMNGSRTKFGVGVDVPAERNAIVSASARASRVRTSSMSGGSA